MVCLAKYCSMPELTWPQLWKCSISPQQCRGWILKVEYSICQTLHLVRVLICEWKATRRDGAQGSTSLHAKLNLSPLFPILFSISIPPAPPLPFSLSFWCHLECWFASCRLPSLCANAWSRYSCVPAFIYQCYHPLKYSLQNDPKSITRPLRSSVPIGHNSC